MAHHILNQPCVLDADGFCARHGKPHVGHIRTLALDPGPKGSQHRLLWDQRAGLAPVPARRAAAVERSKAQRVFLREAPADVQAVRRSQCQSCSYFQADGSLCTHPRATETASCNRVTTAIRSAYSYCPDTPSRWDRWYPPAVEVKASTILGTLAQRFDEYNLAPGQPGKRFNAALLEWQGSLIMAYRDGWAGSNIHIARLGSDLQPISTHKLALRHRDAQHGREDPRLVIHQDRLHVVFIGVMSRPRLHTNVLYARLTDDFQVEQVYHPQVPRRNYWEKNHSYFSHDGTLYAIYSIAPHRVLRIEGDRAEWAFETPTVAPWSGGELRGGASPVRVGAEYWHFFHGRAHHQGATAYNVGLVTFAAAPPFPVRRITPAPILWAEHATKPPDQYVSCVFPCGAVRRGEDWWISSGIHDRWTEIHRFRHADLEQSLVEVSS